MNTCYYCGKSVPPFIHTCEACRSASYNINKAGAHVYLDADANAHLHVGKATLDGIPIGISHGLGLIEDDPIICLKAAVNLATLRSIHTMIGDVIEDNDNGM